MSTNFCQVNNRPCLCGCGQPMGKKRKGAKFFSETCKTRYHARDRRRGALDLRKVVTVAEYARLMGKPEWKIRYEIAKGRIKPVRVPARIMIRIASAKP